MSSCTAHLYTHKTPWNLPKVNPIFGRTGSWRKNHRNLGKKMKICWFQSTVDWGLIEQKRNMVICCFFNDFPNINWMGFLIFLFSHQKKVLVQFFAPPFLKSYCKENMSYAWWHFSISSARKIVQKRELFHRSSKNQGQIYQINITFSGH